MPCTQRVLMVSMFSGFLTDNFLVYITLSNIDPHSPTSLQDIFRCLAISRYNDSQTRVPHKHRTALEGLEPRGDHTVEAMWLMTRQNYILAYENNSGKIFLFKTCCVIKYLLNRGCLHSHAWLNVRWWRYGTETSSPLFAHRESTCNRWIPFT